ncbi:MAG: ChaN family lipoprotein [Hydrogenophaga sp.]
MNCQSAVTWRTVCLTAVLATTTLLNACVIGVGAGVRVSATAPTADHTALQGLTPTDVWLLGEQHDAPAHQARQREVVSALQARGVLAALVMEMAERSGSTRGLPTGASEAQVLQALNWPASEAAGWQWAVYGPLVMQGVRAGVPVLGGNLPRAELRAAMQNSAFDQRLKPEAWKTQQDNIREGHCQMLPETQIVPMTRAQLARDAAMAQTIETALLPGKTVLLVAGNQHVRRDIGVPQHLKPGIRNTVVVMASGDLDEGENSSFADQVWRTETVPNKDHCAAFKAQMKKPQ